MKNLGSFFGPKWTIFELNFRLRVKRVVVVMMLMVVVVVLMVTDGGGCDDDDSDI